MAILCIQSDATVVEVFEGGLVVRSTAGCSDHVALTGLGGRSISALVAEEFRDREIFDSMAKAIEKLPGNWTVELSGLTLPLGRLIDDLSNGFCRTSGAVGVYAEPYCRQVALTDNSMNVKCLLIEHATGTALYFDSTTAAAIAVGVLYRNGETGSIHLIDAQHGFREDLGLFQVSKVETARVLLNVLGIDFNQREVCEQLGLSDFCPFNAGCIKTFAPLFDF